MNPQVHARMVQTTATDTVIGLLQDAGYDVESDGHCYPNDLLINGTLRVEIRGALWTKHAHSKGRYQFQTRTDADIYILVCLTHTTRFFVVPGRVIGTRANVAIWSEFPSKYTGRWAEYCDNWTVIEQELGR